MSLYHDMGAYNLNDMTMLEAQLSCNFGLQNEDRQGWSQGRKTPISVSLHCTLVQEFLSGVPG